MGAKNSHKIMTWAALKQFALDKHLTIVYQKTASGYHLYTKYGKVTYVTDVIENVVDELDIESTVIKLNADISSIPQSQKHKLVRWNAGNIDVTSGSFQDVYAITGPSLFVGCIFHLNTDKMDLRIEIDGEVVIDIDLNEMKDDFVLKSGGGGDDSDSRSSSSRHVDCIGIREYDNKRWAYCPPFPTNIITSLKIQMKSQSGTKKVYRALTSIME